MHNFAAPRLALFVFLCTSYVLGAPCDDVTTEAGKARCYSSRCKEALDGWLPPRDELQCSKGVEIVVYRSRAGAPAQLDPVREKVSRCNNPALFGGACSPGGRFGQLTHGDVHVKWICRRNEFKSDYEDLTKPFSAVAVIATNQRTGATCFWNDDSASISGDDWPSLDVAHAPPDQVNQLAKHFAVSEGGGCIYCHDNDPFVYTPYLRSVGWMTDEYTRAPFARVLLKGEPASIGYKMLTAPDAQACTTCHRITTGRTCMSWAPNAMGQVKEFGHEPSVLAALDRFVVENGVKVRKPGENWSLAYWMPPRPATEWADWRARFGKAEDAVLKCCSEYPLGINSPGCTWAPIPGFAP